MSVYEQFLKLDRNTSWIGLEKGNEDVNYFCTPVGAKIIGWEGVDGIHYCFIEGFKEMVFAVNPMSCCDRYVYPLADTFEIFLRLILSTNSATTLEQIILWNKKEFEQFLASEDSRILPEQLEILNTLKSELNVTPHPQPYEYVKELQLTFDYNKIIFSEEYYDVLGLTKP